MKLCKMNNGINIEMLVPENIGKRDQVFNSIIE